MAELKPPPAAGQQAARRTRTTTQGGVAQLAALLDQAGFSGRARRSSLSRWMRANHDRFATMLADKEPGWDDVAAGLAAMGLRDGDGKPPTGERARKAWWTARRGKAAAQARRHAAATAAAAPLLAEGELAPGVRAVAKAMPLVGGTASAAAARDGVASNAPRLQLDIRPALPRDDQVASPATPAASSGPATPSSAASPDDSSSGRASDSASDDAAEWRRQLHQQMGAGKLRLPKVVL